MPNDPIAISSGHGKYVSGATPPYMDEVTEARRVVAQVATELKKLGVTVRGPFNDDVSTTQDQNLNRIVNWHNSQQRQLDVSVHFNANAKTSKPMGTECLYVSQATLAGQVAEAIAEAGRLKDRGGKKRTDLFFLNNTAKPALLIEVCFVDSSADKKLYNDNFGAICAAIAQTISGKTAPGPTPEPPPATEAPPVPAPTRSTVKKGSTGPDVVAVQNSLGVYPADGNFGSITDAAVKGYQAACSISADGIVGSQTWERLDELDTKVAAGGEGLDPDLVNAIADTARHSEIAGYSWKDRGKAPVGYTIGIALCFALALRRLDAEDDAAWEMAKANTGNPDKDVLAWYADKFANEGMDNSQTGPDTLRHLFALMLGLGLRESSGRYPEGRDQSASNVSSDTAEASFCQTSWNIRTCNATISPLLAEFWANPCGFRDHFKEGVTLKSSDLGNFGSGAGAQYQFLSKFAPTFHSFVTAVGLRNLRQHWGPINRYEAELKSAADAMLQAVQSLVDGTPQLPPPAPEV